jgi:hypothetical protein
VKKGHMSPPKVNNSTIKDVEEKTAFSTSGAGKTGYSHVGD